jgi:hypothetical protein
MSEGTMMSTADDHTRAEGGTQTVDLAHFRAKRMRQRLLLVVERLMRAIQQRNAERVWAILDDPEAYRYIPANVREEAIMLAQLPSASLRAPVRLFRYQYLLQRLGDETLGLAEEQTQLALDLAPVSVTEPVRTSPVRELAFSERRSPHGGPRRHGRDRRRTGSR